MQLEKSKPIQLNQLQEALDGILQQKPCSFQSLSADQSIEVKTDIPEIPKQATYPVVGDPHWYSLNDSPHPTTVFTDSSPFAYSHLRNVNCKAGDKSTIEVFQSFQNNALIGGLRGSAAPCASARRGLGGGARRRRRVSFLRSIRRVRGVGRALLYLSIYVFYLRL